MSAQILDGKQLASTLIEALKLRISKLKTQPILYAVNLVKDPSIESYAASQQKTANTLGIDYKRVDASGKSQDEVIAVLEGLLKNPHAAIFIFTPTPKGINLNVINSRIRESRNIEGIYPFNLGLFFLGAGGICPPTPAAAMALLKSSNVPIAGKSAVIVGRSDTVGKPLMHLLLAENATVTVCHSKTRPDQLIAALKAADIVCVCVGKAAFVQKAWIKPETIVIDIDINQMDGKIVGDVAPDVKEVAGFMSPVPGGVGPVTAVYLMHNVIDVLEEN